MMIDYLEALDRSIVQTVNSWNTPFLDEVFWIISGRLIWVLFYIGLMFLAFRKLERRTFYLFLISTIAAVGLADLISVHLFKNVFLRYRPSHHADLTNILHFYLIKENDFYRGGQYGFVSSHATNFFALATIFSLVLKKQMPKLWILLFSLAIIIAFSRLYLGVHYLSDLIVGALLGFLVSFLVYRFIFLKFNTVIINKEKI